MEQRKSGIQDVAALALVVSMYYLLIRKACILGGVASAPHFLRGLVSSDDAAWFADQFSLVVFLVCIVFSIIMYLFAYMIIGDVLKRVNRLDSRRTFCVKCKNYFKCYWWYIVFVAFFCIFAIFIVWYGRFVVESYGYLMLICFISVSVVVCCGKFDIFGGFLLSLGIVIVFYSFFNIARLSGKNVSGIKNASVVVYSDVKEFDGVLADSVERIGDVAYIVRGNSTVAIPWSRLRMIEQ
ncbi:hypothetical protein [Nitratidesulfovibrio sp. 1201_IL3209]|uniref:hypothetical protein n=1 Tax=Nitratidesulfovibrio sp. 1201_IL3209 TaxID=3084053 RepID=UPI002FD9C036